MKEIHESSMEAFDQLSADITIACQPVMDVKIDSTESQNKAAETASGMRALEKKVEAKRKELVAPHNKRVREINDYAKKIAKPIEDATAHLKNELKRWEQHLEKLRLAEQKKLEAERRERERIEAEERKKAEAEIRARQEAERHELERRQAEEKAKAEADKRERAEMAEMFGSTAAPEVPDPDAIERAHEAEAKQAEEQRRREFIAEQARIQREAEAKIRAERERQNEIDANRVKNVAKVWTFEIVDPMNVPSQYCVPDPKLIRKAVRDGVREILGVRIFQDMQVRIR